MNVHQTTLSRKVAFNAMQKSAIEMQLKDMQAYVEARKPNTHWRVARLFATAIIFGGVITVFMLMANVKPSQLAIHTKWKIGVLLDSLIGVAIPVGYIFYRAIYGEHNFDKIDLKIKLQSGRIPTFPHAGKFTSDDHWQRVIVKGSGSLDEAINIDLSTLNKEQSGWCLGYIAKDGFAESGGVAFAALETVIPYTALRMAWNGVRTIAAPIYLAWKGRWREIPKEVGRSLFSIVRAPFYAIAYTLGALYMYVDPPNGRKLLANIERDWNWGEPCETGCWSVRGRQHDFDLGLKTPFYALGCLQPKAIFNVEKGEITYAAPIHGAYNLAVYTDGDGAYNIDDYRDGDDVESVM
ncbi:MAG: hypothetical protein H7A36_04825 [Chlamydiales bacterium]|nr:hypothetical protein [Chlamydiales bacterium]